MALQISASPLVLQLLHTVFPTTCASCQEGLWEDPVPFFCRQCWGTIKPFPDPACPRCGRPFSSSVALQHGPTHQCGNCHKRPLALTQIWSLFPYQTPVKEAITLFKYRSKISLTNHLARLMIDGLPVMPAFDGLMAVPLHPDRLRAREYNQSLLLADRLSRHLGLPLFMSCLLRVKPTTPQTVLSKKKRLRNLRGAFSVTKPARIKGKRILLVDDVFTTGMTLHECAKTLRRAGSGEVYGLTLARML